MHGVRLLNLSGDLPEIETRWNTLGSVIDSHRESDGRCFLPQAETNNYPADTETAYPNLIGTDDFKQVEVIKAYNEFISGRSYVLYDRYIRLISDIMYTSLSKECQYTLYDINGDGIMELILYGRRTYILACGENGLYIWGSDEYYGGSYHFVNGGNLYYRHGGIANTLMHVYEELDSAGECIRRIEVTLYVSPGNDTDSEEDEYLYTYIYSEGEEEREITEEEYDDLVKSISNDDEIEWFPYPDPESTIRYLR